MKNTQFPFVTALLIFLLGNYTYAQYLSLEWVNQIGGTEDDWSRSLAVDDLGNLYIAGSFRETVDFDPETGTLKFTSAGESDVFIQKLDASGSLVWAKQIGGTEYDAAESLALDNLGNIYTFGDFVGTVDFDPGAGELNLESIGMQDVFIQKLDPSGNLVWINQIGGTEIVGSSAIVVDNFNNIYTIGAFGGTVDFDPGAGVINLTATGSLDAFIQKLDASGRLVWVNQISGIGNAGTIPRDLKVDDLDNVHIAGHFDGTVDFDSGAGVYNLTSAGSNDIFIQKLDASGNLIWIKQMGGAQYDQALSLTLDNMGNIYTTGGFGETVDFDPGAGIENLTSAGSFDIFIQKLDTSGNIIWVKQIGGIETDIGKSIVFDNLEKIYVAGWFGEMVDFDPGAGTENLTSAGSNDIFIQELYTSGDLICVKQMGGIENDLVSTIAMGGDGSIYSTGNFGGIADFDPGLDTVNLVSAGGFDSYVLKLSNLATGNNELETNLDIIAYPNPSSHLLYIDKYQNSTINILLFDNLGQKIITKRSNDQITSIDMSNYAYGIYYLSIYNGEYTNTQKIVKF